eukprot:1151356-Pelagomonas_calceolata.AAC.5
MSTQILNAPRSLLAGASVFCALKFETNELRFGFLEEYTQQNESQLPLANAAPCDVPEAGVLF